MGVVVSVNVSKTKGTPKAPTTEIELVEGMGVKGDAHAAPGDRQVSLLMEESIEKARAQFEQAGHCEAVGKGVELAPGVFAENITTRGIDLVGMKIGDEIRVGDTVRMRLTKIGKECHTKCAIYYKVGDCIMPTEGVFCEVLSGGVIKAGDVIEKG